MTLEEISKKIKSCKKCRLCETAINAVPGEGNTKPDLAFIGEAPGKYEDEQGRPFVGRSGKLLENLLSEIGLKREDVWIGNIIKHRPPNNRDPLPNELAACQGYLDMQLQLLRPKLIVTLGRFSMNYFIPDAKISIDHGRAVFEMGYNIYPVYHPAAALRNGNMGRVLRDDFKKIPSILEQLKNGTLYSER